MANMTITVSDSDYKALQYAALDPTEYVQTAAKTRARKAKATIVDLLVAHCNANSIALAVGEDAQVEQAFELGVVKTVAEVEADAAQ